MPFCPECRQEYEEGAARCADCEVDLVEELAPPGAPSLALAIVLVEGVEEAFRACAAAAGVPLAPLEEETERLPEGTRAFLAPEPLLRRLLAAVDAWEGLERDVAHLAGEGEADDEAVPLVRAVRRSEERAPLDPAWLELGPKEVASRAPESVSGLLDWIERGPQEGRARAARTLLRLGAAGRAALARALASWVRRGADEAVQFVARELADSPPGTEDLEPLVEAALDRELAADRRVVALRALGRIGNRDAALRLVDLVVDEDPWVRDEADGALMEITDQDMGFEEGLEGPALEEVRDRWRRWLEDRG